jgi:Flp pilus assembly pilin Flp
LPDSSEAKFQKERREEEMLKKLRNLFRDEGGQDIIEYGLLAFFISIVAIGIIKLIGPLLETIYQAVHDALV